MRKGIALTGCLLVLGCGGDPAEHAREGTGLNGTGEGISSYLSEGNVQFGCAAEPARELPDEMIVVTAEQCLSCLGVGEMLRDVAREARSRQSSTWIGIPAADTAAACPFFRREKITSPVVLLHRRALPNTDFDLLYLRWDSSRQLTAVHSGATGDELMSKRRTGGPSPSTSPTGSGAKTPR